MRLEREVSNDQRQHMDCMPGDCLVARTLGNSDIPCPINKPARTPEMADHQVWVWLNNPGRWEIRGTGLVVDRERQRQEQFYRQGYQNALSDIAVALADGGADAVATWLKENREGGSDE